ncbi:MAG: hypothetical protein JNL22_03055 [Bacteroidales bacterium]|nr:hypothetical protein [Bacteroidales bacterium]
MNKKEDFHITWSTKDTKSLTEDFINHIYDKYYISYKKDSEYYEKINNRIFAIITLIGFLVTILFGIKEIFKNQINIYLNVTFTIVTFILPSISSLLLIYLTQKGYKQKEKSREEARIECKYLVNEARIRFSKNKDNPDELEKLYKWLNEQTRQLQLSQAKNYFAFHNKMDKVDIEK